MSMRLASALCYRAGEGVGVCTSLQIPHIYNTFLSLPCPVLHCIALPVVSVWCQEAPDAEPRASRLGRLRGVEGDGEALEAAHGVVQVPLRLIDKLDGVYLAGERPSTASPSMRATGLPTQPWIPSPKARCPDALRLMSKASGSS